MSTYFDEYIEKYADKYPYLSVLEKRSERLYTRLNLKIYMGDLLVNIKRQLHNYIYLQEHPQDTYIECVNLTHEKMRYPLVKTNIEFDFAEYFTHLYLKWSKTSLPSSCRFRESTDEYLNKRMFYRVECYKHGWSISQIEEYIAKKFYNSSSTLSSANKDYVNVVYHNLCNIEYNSVITRECLNGKRGRPTLPKSIHTQKYKDDMKEKMRKTYKQSQLFTKEEMAYLKELLEAKENQTEMDAILITKLKEYDTPMLK